MSVDYTIPPWEPDLLGNPTDDAPKSRRDLLRESERRFEALADAGAVLVRALRPAGTCLLCHAKAGVAHKETCPATPFILTRAEIVHGNKTT